MTSAAAAREHYEADGYYLCDGPVIPADVVQAAIAGMDEVRQGIYDTGRPPQQSAWKPGDDPERLGKIEMPQMANSAIRTLVSHPAIGAMAAALTSARMVQVWWVQLLYKPPGPGSEDAKVKVGWHQDRHYWSAWEEGSELFTAWVALSQVAADCGPMKFVRGSHRWGLVEGSDFYGQDHQAQQQAIQVPEGESWEEVEAILPPGGISFHHHLTYHASEPNQGPGPRRSFAIHLRTQNSRPAGGEKKGLTGFIDDPTCCPTIYQSDEYPA